MKKSMSYFLFACASVVVCGLQAAPATTNYFQKPPACQTRAEVKDVKIIARTNDRFIAWPSMCRLKNGDILVVFSGDRDSAVCPYGKVQLIRSTDEGQTWSEPQTIASSLVDDRAPGIAQLANGDVVVTWLTSIAFAEG